VSTKTRIQLAVLILGSTLAGGGAVAGGGTVAGVRVPSVQEVGRTVEQTVAKAGSAAEDVVTLGEAGRRRDKERAEAEEKLAAERRANAETARLTKIASLTDQISVLDSITRSYGENQKIVDFLLTLHAQISAIGEAELTSRQKSFAWIERARDSRRKQSNDLKDLVQVLNNLAILDEKLYKAAQSKDAPITDSTKQSRTAALNAARSVIETAQAEGDTSQIYLTHALENLKTDELVNLVALSGKARTSLQSLKGKMQTQSASYSNMLEGKRNELKALQTA